MDQIQGACPKCNKPYKVAADKVGTRARCRACKNRFVIPDVGTPDAKNFSASSQHHVEKPAGINRSSRVTAPSSMGVSPGNDENKFIRFENHIQNCDSALSDISKTLKMHKDEVDNQRDSLKDIKDELRAKLSDSALEEKARQILDPEFGKITDILKAVKFEREELEISEHERREIVQRYKIGTVDRLRQEIQELEKKIDEKNHELSEKTYKIDALEREKILSSNDQTKVEWSKFQDLKTKYESAMGENEELFALRMERDRLEAENRGLRGLEEKYRQNIENSSRNFELEKEQIRQADTIKTLEQEKGQQLVTLEHLKRENERLIRELSNVRENLIEYGKSLQSEQQKTHELNALVLQHETTLQPLKENAEAVQDELQKLYKERADLETKLRDERKNLESEYDRYRSELEQHVEDQQKTRLENEHRAVLDNLSNEIETLRKLYEKSKADRQVALAEKDKFDHEKSSALEDLEALKRRIEFLGNENDRLKDEVDSKKAEMAGLKTEEAELEKRCAILQKDLEDLKDQKNRLGKTVDRNTRIKSIVDPYFTEIPPEKKWDGNETEWLQELEENIEKADFVFPQRLLYAFHTSLKISEISQLTVLAGVSGTGKSELPKLYAHFGGFNFLPVPVQATWDSPQDIFGFYDYLECRYKATSFLKALVQSQSNGQHGFADRLLLILLDEMNLARVELYFSEFLSRLETRRSIAANSNSALSQIEIDIGAGEIPYSISLGHNVMYVGTINEDETTMTLSDKVLDRGNVITFPRPSTLHSRKSTNSMPGSQFWLAKSMWNSWIRFPHECLAVDVLDNLKQDLQDINSALSHVNRAIGHRVLQAIEAYVANYPGVKDKTVSWERPFADQIVQRISPKLRGIEVNSKEGNSCIESVRKVFKKFDISDDFESSLNSSDGAFRWTSSEYIEQSGTV